MTVTRTSADRTLGDLVAVSPQVAPTLDRLGLDYCCHGDRTIAEAAAVAGIDPIVVLDALESVDVDGDVDTSWLALDPAALADHIESVHHAYLHAELPEVAALAAKVLSVHGGRHPELAEVRSLVAAVKADLEPHLADEERTVFPAIRARAAGSPDPDAGSLDDRIGALAEEHDVAGDLLRQLREVTGGFTVPDDACASYESLYQRLEALELDTHLHIHKETHSLFPGAIALGR
jgi:regulator of cell morphogenesis and NO signaling